MDNKIVKSLAAFDTVAACNKGYEYEVLLPNGDASGIFITMLGKDSDEFKKYEREQRDFMNRKIMKSRKRGQDLQLDSAEMSEEKEIDLLTRLTTGWRNVPDFTGEGLLTFNKENVALLYLHYPSIRRQSDEASGDMQNFMMS